MIIAGDHITLRATSPDDPEVKSLLEDPAVWRNLSETRLHPGPMPAQMSFRIEWDGRLIGEIALKTIRWFNRKAELSIFIQPAYHGQGYGRDATRTILRHAFHTLNLHRLEAEVIEFNTRSSALLAGFGFVLEGRARQAKFADGRYWDILRYGLLRSEYEQPAGSSSPAGETPERDLQPSPDKKPGFRS